MTQTRNKNQKTDKSRYRRRADKPPYRFAAMIIHAIQRSPRNMLTLAEIIAAVGDMFSYFRDTSYKGWMDSIRHNLSQYPYFKMCGQAQSSKKANYWTIDPDLIPLCVFQRTNSSNTYKLTLQEELGSKRHTTSGSKRHTSFGSKRKHDSHRSDHCRSKQHAEKNHTDFSKPLHIQVPTTDELEDPVSLALSSCSQYVVPPIEPAHLIPPGTEDSSVTKIHARHKMLHTLLNSSPACTEPCLDKARHISATVSLDAASLAAGDPTISCDVGPSSPGLCPPPFLSISHGSIDAVLVPVAEHLPTSSGEGPSSPCLSPYQPMSVAQPIFRPGPPIYVTSSSRSVEKLCPYLGTPVTQGFTPLVSSSSILPYMWQLNNLQEPNIDLTGFSERAKTVAGTILRNRLPTPLHCLAELALALDW